MIAALPMYLRPETLAATDALWRATRDALHDLGHDAPDTLSHDEPLVETWRSPDLILGQICNLPYRMGKAGAVGLVGTADHRLEGAPAGHYHSVIVIRRPPDGQSRPTWQSLQDGVFAVNGGDSQSGWGAATAHARSLGITIKRTLTTGAHRESARAVAEGRADWAALDAVTWRIVTRWDAFAKGLTVIARTAATPGLAYITAAGRDPEPIRTALSHAFDTLPEATLHLLGAYGLCEMPRAEYDRLPLPQALPN